MPEKFINQYNLDQARNETSRMEEKIKKGEAKDYNEAENLFEEEKRKELIKKLKEHFLRIIPVEKITEKKKDFGSLIELENGWCRLENILLAKHVDKLSLAELKNKYGDDFQRWLKESNSDGEFGMIHELDNLIDSFFNFSDESDGPWNRRNGIINHIDEGPVYHETHKEAGLWLLSKLLRNLPSDEIKKAIDSFNLNNPEESMIKLGEQKIAEGIKLAEVAGASYASIIAFLGGEGTCWLNNAAVVLKPANIDKLQTIEEKKQIYQKIIGNNDLMVDFERNGLAEKYMEPNDYCDDKNYSKVFKDDYYDIFMAINFGPKGDYHEFTQVAKKILKEKEGKNTYFAQGV